jgi:hypothetical protein
MEINKTTVGIDVATGFAADSFFDTKAKYDDPWKEESLENLIDLIINHKQTVFPSPTKKARDTLDDSQTVPKIFVDDFKLIKPYKTTTAEEIPIPEEIMIEEFDVFKKWTYENNVNFKNWVDFHTKTDYLITRQQETVPIYSVEDFLMKENRMNLAKELEINNPKSFIYAFDVWFRTAKYYNIFGSESIHYFPHKFRRAAITNKMDKVNQYQKIKQYQKQWSWGKYFVNTMKNDEEYKDLEWLVNNVSTIRKETQKNGATWYDLDEKNMSLDDKINIITNIAADSDLPGKFKKGTEKSIKTTYLILNATASTFNLACPNDTKLLAITVLLTFGEIPLMLWEGEVKGSLRKLPIFKGCIEWPSLTS